MSLTPVNRARLTLVYDWSLFVQRLFYPPHCHLCGQLGDQGDICTACKADLPRLEPGCLQCAMPLAAAAGPYCGECLRRPPAFDRVTAPLRYAAPVDALIKLLKFQRSLAAARLLGELLSEHIGRRRQPLPQLLLPIPLHPARLSSRGFNQASELAKPLAQRLGLPLSVALLHRVRDTASQSELPASARRSNVRGAFALRGKPPRHVALIDDVMTTGHTAHEAARVLRRAGAKRVEVWVVARAVGRRRA